MFLRSGLTLSAWRLVARPVALMGGALLVGGVLAATVGGAPVSLAPAFDAQSYRLVLDTENDPACVYGSAWNDGDVVMPHDASDGKTVRFTTRYDFLGCTWESTETLTPSESGYEYEYAEHIVECKKDATPGLACPRTGHVTVVPNL